METLNNLLSNDMGYIQALRSAQPLPKTVYAAPTLPTKPKVNRGQVNAILIATGIIIGVYVTIQIQQYFEERKNMNNAYPN
jgi:hypothetical protein